MTLTPLSRVYIAGAGGMLGDAMYKQFSANYHIRASDLVPRAGWLSQVDVAEYEALLEDVAAFGSDVLINLAARTDLEACECDPDRAWRDNALGAENAALVAERLQIPIVYISTAGIFNGHKEEYHDYDTPDPLTVYGQSKLYGEVCTQRTAKRHFVLRAGWMMGGGPELDKKFVNKIYKQIRSGSTVIRAVSDKFGTPTYTRDFARGVERLLLTELYGVYNQVCSGRSSRFDVAEHFIGALGLADKIVVLPVGSEYFEREYFANRPVSEQLVNFKLNQRGLNVMRTWQECLDEYALCFRDDLMSGEDMGRSQIASS